MTEPASIRYKNPGAMWGSARAVRWGAQKNPVTLHDGKGQGNNIAVFPDFVHGAAAQFDLWRAQYTNMTLLAAIKKWSGGNSSAMYMNFLESHAGIDGGDVVTVDLLASPKGIALMKAQAHWEAGKEYPMSDEDWERAQEMVFSGVGSSEPAPHVQPQKSAYNLDVEIVQRKLDHLGYHEVGDIDGKWGGKTKGALTAFLNDRHVDIVVNGGLTPAINEAVSDALAEGWSRPIAASRAQATAQDIAPKVTAVRQSLWQRLGAKIAGFGAGGAALVSGASDQFASVNDKISPVKQFFASTPGWVWFALIAMLAVIAYLSADKIKSATVADYNTGKIN